MEWVDINENLINLKWVRAITKTDRSFDYGEPFLLVFEMENEEYSLSFPTREERESYRINLFSKLK